MNLTFKEEIPFGMTSLTFEITGNVIFHQIAPLE